MLHNNFAAFIVTLLLSIIWLRFVGYAVIKDWIPNSISRKVIHIGTGPLFVLCWLLFEPGVEARYLAAIVPLTSSVQFALAGWGILKDKSSVQSMSRTGEKKELTKGPFYYGLAFTAITLAFWNTNPIGLVALMILCGGDGLADIFGKKYGKALLPWSRVKTWKGSFAMLFGGLIFTILMISIFDYFSVFSIVYSIFLPKLFIIAFISTLIESISKSDIDNITVPLAAIITGLILNL